MKARIFYVTKKAFHEDPSWIFTNAEKTEQQLDKSGLKNFVEIDTHEDQNVKSKLDFAEKLFMIYNTDSNPLSTKQGQERIRKLGAGHTSMSVNDFVVIDGSILIVDTLGFKNIGFHKVLEDIDLR